MNFFRCILYTVYTIHLNQIVPKNVLFQEKMRLAKTRMKKGNKNKLQKLFRLQPRW